MNQINEQIAQCKKDIETLQTSLRMLEEEKTQQTTLKSGDIAENDKGALRLIVADADGLFSVNVQGIRCISEHEFNDWGYKKIGRISDFIKEN